MTRFALLLVLLATTAASAQDESRPLPPLLAARSGPGMRKIDADLGHPQGHYTELARGLKWLANQQKAGGYWAFDRVDPKRKHKDWATSTGLALLPFLGVNQTPARDGKYKTQIADGLTWLANDVNLTTGRFTHVDQQYMTGHAIVALALCEAHAMTGDAALQAPAQAALDFILKSQAADGGWGDEPGTPGDMAVTGWQFQALFAAQQGKLTVPDATIKKGIDFLNRVSSGPFKENYGRTKADGRPGTALTAEGLLCRYRFDGWGPNNIGMAVGTIGLFGAPKANATDTVTKTDRACAPRTRAQVERNPATPDMDYFYHASQVVYYFGGPERQEWFDGPKAADGTRQGGLYDLADRGAEPRRLYRRQLEPGRGRGRHTLRPARFDGVRAADAGDAVPLPAALPAESVTSRVPEPEPVPDSPRESGTGTGSGSGTFGAGR